MATALGALARINGVPAGRVQVIGDGLLGRLVERLLPAGFGSGRPLAVVEATGSDSNLRRAISTVETLGTVVLAAPLDVPAVQVAGYTDIHVRGLTVVGLAWVTDPTQVPAALVDWALACLAQAGDGGPTSPAPWYRCDP